MALYEEKETKKVLENPANTYRYLKSIMDIMLKDFYASESCLNYSITIVNLH